MFACFFQPNWIILDHSKVHGKVKKLFLIIIIFQMHSARVNQRQQIEELAQNSTLLQDMEILPHNYNFEIPKTIWKIRTIDAKIVALQFPEGLTMFACVIVDILEKHTGAEFIILGDLLVHYGHSCLVPIQDTVGIHLLYVFVNIDMGTAHLLDTLRHNFLPTAGDGTEKAPKLALVSTVQFVATLQIVKRELAKDGFDIVIPQCNPLSPGELLGCTAPVLPKDVTTLVYLGDGRFHLESAMIQNPSVPAYQYNPYSREFTRERYGTELMLANRRAAVAVARDAQCFGLILGTLGRQGNAKIFNYLEQKLKEAGKRVIGVLLSEIFSDKLALFASVQCWVQVACPRLSIDWGHTFTAAPLLTPFELSVALDRAKTEAADSAPPPLLTEYPMDFYAYDSAGPWTNNHSTHRSSQPRRTQQRREHISLRN
ncbi:hypothetical protein niasHS_015385 [Heterodera schachtii]|uniref:2-(3-amino-3-carboxypropyl)histidine synthase subunit 1 n=1 Tax=Heterodera schachtii TaxID=97005 RepID=A0ABD2I544_HETSC